MIDFLFGTMITQEVNYFILYKNLIVPACSEKKKKKESDSAGGTLIFLLVSEFRFLFKF